MGSFDHVGLARAPAQGLPCAVVFSPVPDELVIILTPLRALYIKGDPYETSDAVFGVKKSLVIDLGKVDAAQAAEYGVAEGTWLLQHEFVLVTKDETEKLRDRNAMEALQKLGLNMKLVDHLPVPDLD